MQECEDTQFLRSNFLDEYKIKKEGPLFQEFPYSSIQVLKVFWEMQGDYYVICFKMTTM